MGSVNRNFNLMEDISQNFRIGRKEFLEDIEFIDRFADICGQEGIHTFEVEAFVGHVLERKLNDDEKVAMQAGIKMGWMLRGAFLN